MLCSLVVCIEVVRSVRQQLKLVLCASSMLSFCLPGVSRRVVLLSRDPAEIRGVVVPCVAVYVVYLERPIVFTFRNLAICLRDNAMYRDKPSFVCLVVKNVDVVVRGKLALRQQSPVLIDVAIFVYVECHSA